MREVSETSSNDPNYIVLALLYLSDLWSLDDNFISIVTSISFSVLMCLSGLSCILYSLFWEVLVPISNMLHFRGWNLNKHLFAHSTTISRSFRIFLQSSYFVVSLYILGSSAKISCLQIVQQYFLIFSNYCTWKWTENYHDHQI